MKSQAAVNMLMRNLSKELKKRGIIIGMFNPGPTATDLMSRYCRTLYARLGSYEQVARQIALDRRTVKKYIERG